MDDKMKYLKDRIESIEKDILIVKFLYEKMKQDFDEVYKEKEEWKNKYNDLTERIKGFIDDQY